MTDRLVWIDCEMTGLNLTTDALIEVAALVTDSELNVLGEGVDLIIKPSRSCAKCTSTAAYWTNWRKGSPSPTLKIKYWLTSGSTAQTVVDLLWLATVSQPIATSWLET